MPHYNPDIPYWLATLYLQGIGPVRFIRLLEHFHDIKRIFGASAEELKACGLLENQIQSLKNPNWDAVDKDLIWCEKNDCHLISYVDEYYPKLLREISSAPLLLFVKGDITSLLKSQLAIVGSRNPTVTGRETAEQFSYCFAQADLVITSGMALGIDAASHHGALNAGGKTIAVCGTGLKHIYPASNKKLAQRIQENGALISEFPPDASPKAEHFPRRNRVISGLSLGVLVIEAALRSGSLITSRFAIDQGREVFALPGSIHNPLSKGCHYLLRQGAKLVETAQDVLEELGTINATITYVERKKHNLDQGQQRLLSQIGYEITPLDAIIIRSGLTTAKVSYMLLLLELEGYVISVPGGYVRVGSIVNSLS